VRAWQTTEADCVPVPVLYRQSSGHLTEIDATLYASTTMTSPQRPSSPQKEGKLFLASQFFQGRQIKELA
jgi:hypothetical protein